MESSGRLHIRDEAIDDAIHLLELEGELDLYNAPEFQERLAELVKSGERDVVIDLSGVTFLGLMDAAAVPLVGFMERLRADGRLLALVCSEKRILRPFEISGLDQLFEIHPTRDEARRALAAFRRSRQTARRPDKRRVPAPGKVKEPALATRSQSRASRTKGASDDEEVAIIELGGEVDLYHASEFKERMVELIESGKKHVIIDLSRATFFDETDFGVLVGGVKRLRPAGGSLALVITDDNIAKIFEITGLDRVFPIHSSREEALAALGVDVESGSAQGREATRGPQRKAESALRGADQVAGAHIRRQAEEAEPARREAENADRARGRVPPVKPARLTHEQLLAADANPVFFNLDGAYESAVISGVTYVPVPPGTYPHDWPDWIRADCESREDAEARAAHTMDALKRALVESAADECPPGMDEREVEQRLRALAEAVSPEGEFPSPEWLMDAREAHFASPEP